MAAVSALNTVDTEVLLHPRTGYLIVLIEEVEHVAGGGYIFTALPLVSWNLNLFNLLNISQSKKKSESISFFLYSYRKLSVVHHFGHYAQSLMLWLPQHSSHLGMVAGSSQTKVEKALPCGSYLFVTVIKITNLTNFKQGTFYLTRGFEPFQSSSDNSAFSWCGRQSIMVDGLGMWLHGSICSSSNTHTRTHTCIKHISSVVE